MKNLLSIFAILVLVFWVRSLLNKQNPAQWDPERELAGTGAPQEEDCMPPGKYLGIHPDSTRKSL